MNKPVISFDLDDVIARFNDQFFPEVSALTGRDVPVHACTDFYGVHKLFGLDEYPNDWLIESRFLERLELNPYALDAIAAAKETGHHTIIVTARGWHPRGREVTERWLEEKGAEVDTLHVVPLSAGAKTAVFDQYPDIRWHIDDSPGFAVEARQHRNVRSTAIFHRPWNAHLGTSLTTHRVNCLREFANLIDPVVETAPIV